MVTNSPSLGFDITPHRVGDVATLEQVQYESSDDLRGGDYIAPDDATFRLEMVLVADLEPEKYPSYDDYSGDYDEADRIEGMRELMTVVGGLPVPVFARMLDGTYQHMDGAHRLAIAHHLGREFIPVWVVS